MTPKADFFTGIGLVVFASVMFNIAGKMSKPVTYGLGPGGYPMLVTGVLFLLGMILAIQGLLEKRRAARQDSQTKVVTLAELKGIAILAASFWAYIAVLKYLGYLIATPVFLFLFLFLYGGRKWLQMILISLITTGITWALFVHAFRIFLPNFYFF
jgi:uncharacterized membrane protein YgcG